MISGTESANATARFVGEGIANETNYPGGRYGNGAAISDSGLWISSGFGMDDNGNEGFLGDLWKYSFPVSEIVCGDGIVQDGEDCDGGICCSSDCTFVASDVICRESAGACDKPETCSGEAPSCPADEFLPSGTPCGEIVGFCDVLTQSTCEGDSAVCHGTEPLQVLIFRSTQSSSLPRKLRMGKLCHLVLWRLCSKQWFNWRTCGSQRQRNH